MDNTVITIEGELVLVKVNKTQGFFIQVSEITPDKFKKGWWDIKFFPLVPTKEFKLREASWKLDEDQIRGAEFTMNHVPHQLFKVEYEGNIPEVKTNANSPVPLPKPKLVKKPESSFLKTELIPGFNEREPEKPRSYERSYLKLVK